MRWRIAPRSWRALGLETVPPFPQIDRMLDSERREGRAKRLWPMLAAGLPDGAMFREADRFLAIRHGHALPGQPRAMAIRFALPAGTVRVLTPPATLAALRAGYQPVWHSSAQQR